MIAFICVDERDGLSFGGRRQSRDGAVTDYMIKTVGAGRLWVSPYSATLFSESISAHWQADEHCLQKAGKGEFVFAEDLELPADCEAIYCFCWNRHYPADRVWDRSAVTAGMTVTQTEEFVGTSHEKITVTVYRKQEEKQNEKEQ